MKKGQEHVHVWMFLLISGAKVSSVKFIVIFIPVCSLIANAIEKNSDKKQKRKKQQKTKTKQNNSVRRN